MTRHLSTSALALITVKIRYTYQRDGLLYYQRHIPSDLAGRLPGRLVKVPLGTADPVRAARLVQALNAKHERQWALLRADPKASASAAEAQAVELLMRHGLKPHDPSPSESSLEALLRSFESARDAYAGHDEGVWRDAEPSAFLGPVEAAAVKLLKPKTDKLADALEVYLSAHVKGDSADRRTYATRVISSFVAVVGDRPVVEIRRADVRAYIDHETARGIKTGTIRRRLKDLRAVFERYALEKELAATVRNPFEKHQIKGEGEDAEEGNPLAADDWAGLARLCRQKDDPVRWLIALQMATGARIAEVVGLSLAEIDLAADVPHIVITANAARGIKTDKAATSGTAAKRSFRAVPLVGVGLWAARRIFESAAEGQTYAFPRYIGTDGKAKSDGASATVNKWIKGQGLDHTSHDFRHTMRDRLRNTGCPEEVAHEIGGWAKESVGSKVYGDGHLLSIRQKHLQAAFGES